jgi:hypothetical protein
MIQTVEQYAFVYKVCPEACSALRSVRMQLTPRGFHRNQAIMEHIRRSSPATTEGVRRSLLVLYACFSIPRGTFCVQPPIPRRRV